MVGVLAPGSTSCAALTPLQCTADLALQRMKMLAAVRQQATAIAGMQASDRLCLTQQQYLDIFRLQQAHQQGQGLPRVFPEQQIQFAFEEGGLIFAVNHSGAIRCGIPYWTGDTALHASHTTWSCQTQEAAVLALQLCLEYSFAVVCIHLLMIHLNLNAAVKPHVLQDLQHHARSCPSLYSVPQAQGKLRLVDHKQI